MEWLEELSLELLALSTTRLRFSAGAAGAAFGLAL